MTYIAVKLEMSTPKRVAFHSLNMCVDRKGKGLLLSQASDSLTCKANRVFIFDALPL